MKGIAAAPRVKVSADGHGVVSHAGMGLLRELAELTGLSAQVTAALADTYKGPWLYAPGAVFADLAAAWAAGANPAPGGWLHIDIDATLTIDHSDNKENAAATWKKTYGHHRAGQPAMPQLRSQCCMARSHLGCKRSRSLGQLIGFVDQPEIARCEIATFRYRVLHVAARITRGARQLRLRIDATWRWARAITTAWHRIRAAFP